MLSVPRLASSQALYAAPLVKVLQAQGPNGWAGRVAFPLTYLFYAWLDGLARLVWMASGKRPVRWEFFLPIVELALLCVAAGGATGVMLFVVMHTVFSVVALWTAYPLHYADFSLTEGAPDQV
jgi:hypothetical protein